jgi:glutaredoxin 3
MAEITVYTAEPSVVCARVKNLLDKRGVPYTEIKIETDEDREALMRRSGRKSCPLVYAGDTLVGGLEETVTAVESGALIELSSR